MSGETGFMEASDVAQQAIQIAVRAQAELSAHVSECSRNYLRVEKSFTDLHHRLDAANKILLSIAGGLIALMSTMLVDLWVRLHH